MGGIASLPITGMIPFILTTKSTTTPSVNKVRRSVFLPLLENLMILTYGLTNLPNDLL